MGAIDDEITMIVVRAVTVRELQGYETYFMGIMNEGRSAEIQSVKE